MDTPSPQLNNTPQSSSKSYSFIQHFHIPQMVIVGLVMLFVGLVGGYLLFGNKTTPYPLNQVTKVIPTTFPKSPPTDISPTAMVDKTVTWKLYSDNQHNFSIDYPATFQISSTNSGELAAFTLFLPSTCPQCEKPNFIYTINTANTTNTNIQDAVPSDIGGLSSGFNMNKDFQIVTIAGTQGLLSLKGVPGQEYSQAVYFLHNSKLYSIRLDTFGGTNQQNEYYYNLLKDMIPTFKFIN